MRALLPCVWFPQQSDNYQTHLNDALAKVRIRRNKTHANQQTDNFDFTHSDKLIRVHCLSDASILTVDYELRIIQNVGIIALSVPCQFQFN